MSDLGKFIIEDGVLKAYDAGTETDIRIPEGVHTIGEGVFKGMSWILSVELPSTLKTISASAFKGCRKMKSITFPEGLLEIGEYAFHKCHDLEELLIPKTMTKVGSCAFLYCDGLKRAMMEGPKSMGKAVFSHNMSLQEISLNSEIDDSNFADEVFEGCVNLRKITLSGKTFEISNLIEAMDSHSEFPRVIKSIAKSIYHSMQIEDGVLSKFTINLKNISLPEGITTIGKGCFFDKKGIVSITLPGSLKKIRANAFLNCIGLEEITFQNSDVFLDSKAFRGCCNLKKVNLPDDTFLLENETENELVGRIREQVLGDFYISGRILVRYMGNEEQVSIPKEVEIIGERCFFKNEQVKTVLCPEGLTEIREEAFGGCVTLQNIVLPVGLKTIGREAFAECKKLQKCNIPDTVTDIGEYAFRRCFMFKDADLKKYPNTDIHPYAFYLAGQSELTKQLMQKSLKTENPEETYPDGDAYIKPYSCLRKNDLKILKLNGIKRIGKYAYSSCPELEEIIIDAPECVIEEKAFSVCPKLKKVKLHVKELGKGIFSFCRHLESVSLSGVSVLPALCFEGCSELKKIESGDVIRMGARCFDECVSLDSFDFTDIKLIGERAFERCDSLKHIKLGETECGFHAFADCASLRSIEITLDTKLKSGAFIGCTQVNSIAFNGQVYTFDRFSDSFNHVGSPYPVQVREVIASIYSCFDIREEKQLKAYNRDASKITIPSDIEEIGQDVFRDHIRLKEIAIPESVTIFGSHAFSMTAWLDEQRKTGEMVIVNDVLLDGANCKGKVVIPSHVKKVAGWCFAGNIGITELFIPSEQIGIENLAFRNCLNLKKISDWNGEEYRLCSISDPEEKEYPDTVKRIFSECVNCFKLDEDGNLVESTGNITDLVFPDGIKSIGDGVYKDCHLLETIVLSSDTQTIGKSAFENSKWLKNVSNAGSIYRIDAQAFSGCQSLENIDLSDNLREMGKRCFEHCVNLQKLTVSKRLEKIPERAFFRCKSLKTVTIPENVRVIEAEAFAFCDSLEDVYIHESTLISDSAFAYADHAKVHRL